MSEPETAPGEIPNKTEATKTPEPPAEAALVALLRLLLREPPAGHDVKNCPICKRFGITKI